MPRVLLLIPSASYRTTDFMDAASRLDLEIVVGSDRDQPLAELFPGRTLTLAYNDHQRGAEEITRFADRFPLDAVVAVDEQGTVLAAQAAQRLDLPHNPLPAVLATRDKSLLRERLAAAGLPSPAFRLARFAEDVPELAAELTFPLVIKPLSLSASRGVIRCDDPGEFAKGVSQLRAILEEPATAAECGENSDRYLIEAFIPGREVALEGLLQNGRLHPLALFDKPDPLDGPYFEETIYVTPSRLAEKDQRAVQATSEQAAAALGLRDGPLHAELRINEAGAWPVDIAARTIGGLCARSLRFGDGTPLEEVVLRQAVGAPIESLNRETLASGVMMIPIPRRGTLESISGLDDAREVSGVTAVEITARPGQELVPLPERGDYLGFIFAKAETPEAVERALREAHAAFHLQIV